MSVLADIQTALSVLGIPIETGVFTDAEVVPPCCPCEIHRGGSNR